MRKTLYITSWTDDVALLARQAEGFWEVSSLGDIADAPGEIASGRYDFLLFDIDLTGAYSLELLASICSMPAHPPVVILSREYCLIFLKAAISLGVRCYFTIPYDFKRVRERIERFLDEGSAVSSPGVCGAGDSGVIPLSGEVARSFIGTSRVSSRIRSEIAAVCACPDPVLITGETGSGKELVARIIHDNSLVFNGPYKAENVSCIPPTLAESVLFGSVRGGYTDALDAVGLIEASNGGSLFLDEIGELDLALQPKLLRVLEDGKVKPVGSVARRPVSFRLICATNRDLASLVATGKFRKDLFFRLDVLRIEIPPLRERPEDIPLLAAYRLAGCRKRLSPDALDKLTLYRWPGNVRQLFNCLSRAARSSRTDVIYPEQIRF